MQLNPHLNFNGQCEAAFHFYERCLGGKIVTLGCKIVTVMSHENTPMADRIPADWRGKIMHAHLQMGENHLMGSDAPAEHFQKPQGFSVSLQIKDPAEADRIFAALAEGGAVRMPIQKTFWALRFGMVTDQFGTPWIINCDPPRVKTKTRRLHE